MSEVLGFETLLSHILFSLFFFFLECSENMYGENCTEKCGSCLNSEQCHPINGTCMKGCDRGFQGSSCIESKLIYNTIKSYSCLFASKIFH